MLDPQRPLFRWGPISACPLFMHYTIERSFFGLEELLGYGYPESIILFKEKKVTWLLDEEFFSEAGASFTARNIFNDTNKQHYFSLWTMRTERLLEVLSTLDKTDLSTLSAKELDEFFVLFSAVYYEWWELAISIELVTTFLEPYLGKNLKQCTELVDERDFSKAFAVLTAPRLLTFYRREQRDLLNIQALPTNEQDEALKTHQQQYHWIYNSYLEANELSVDYFREQLAEMNYEDATRILQEIDTYERSIADEKDQLIAALHLDDLKEVITLIETFATLQDDRKMYNFMANAHLERFASAFSEHTGLKTEDIKLFLPAELHSGVRTAFNRRQEGTAIHASSSGLVYHDGAEAQKVISRFTDIQEVRGSTLHGALASSGDLHYFRGIAKVVYTIDEIDKINEGDVLVTTMTSPDFVIGMKKAGAIVTDVGGMLSHAAIVARELKVPCVVGTNDATKMIKDGDVVELHCWRGRIKILRGDQQGDALGKIFQEEK